MCCLTKMAGIKLEMYVHCTNNISLKIIFPQISKCRYVGTTHFSSKRV